MKTDQPRAWELPFVECDFNAQGWSGDGDLCFYALDQGKLAVIGAHDGMSVFLYDIDEPGTILGYIAKLQRVASGSFCGWRAEPMEGTFYRGPMPDRLAAEVRHSTSS